MRNLLLACSWLATHTMILTNSEQRIIWDSVSARSAKQRPYAPFEPGTFLQHSPMNQSMENDRLKPITVSAIGREASGLLISMYLIMSEGKLSRGNFPQLEGFLKISRFHLFPLFPLLT